MLARHRQHRILLPWQPRQSHFAAARRPRPGSNRGRTHKVPRATQPAGRSILANNQRLAAPRHAPHRTASDPHPPRSPRQRQERRRPPAHRNARSQRGAVNVAATLRAPATKHGLQPLDHDIRSHQQHRRKNERGAVPALDRLSVLSSGNALRAAHPHRPSSPDHLDCRQKVRTRPRPGPSRANSKTPSNSSHQSTSGTRAKRRIRSDSSAHPGLALQTSRRQAAAASPCLPVTQSPRPRISQRLSPRAGHGDGNPMPVSRRRVAASPARQRQCCNSG
jgi:hypothetical protein